MISGKVVWFLRLLSPSVHLALRELLMTTTVILGLAAFELTTWMIDTTLSYMSSSNSKSNGRIKREWVNAIPISEKMNSNHSKSVPKIPNTLPTLNGQPQELFPVKVGYPPCRMRIDSLELLAALLWEVVVLLDQSWMSLLTEEIREAVIAIFSQSQLPTRSLCTKQKVKMIHCLTTFQTASSLQMLMKEGSVLTNNTQEAVPVTPTINSIT